MIPTRYHWTVYLGDELADIMTDTEVRELMDVFSTVELHYETAVAVVKG